MVHRLGTRLDFYWSFQRYVYTNIICADVFPLDDRLEDRRQQCSLARLVVEACSRWHEDDETDNNKMGPPRRAYPRSHLYLTMSALMGQSHLYLHNVHVDGCSTHARTCTCTMAPWTSVAPGTCTCTITTLMGHPRSHLYPHHGHLDECSTQHVYLHDDHVDGCGVTH